MDKPLSNHNGSIFASYAGGFANFVEPFKGAQAQRETLRSTTNPDEAGYRPVFSFFLDAQVGQSVLT
jgi:hypothetical protein